MTNYMTPLQRAAWRKRVEQRKQMKEEPEERVFEADTAYVEPFGPKKKVAKKKVSKKKASKKKFTKKS